MVNSPTKPHVVFVPYPAQGHVTPMMRLAKLLHSRGFHVTFVNTEFNHRRLIRSKGPESVAGLPDFRFETIPDGMPPTSDDDLDATQDVPLLCHYTRKTCLEPFKKLLRRLDATADVPKVSCVVSDGVMSVGMKGAQEMGIPEVRFWTASAASMIGYLHYAEARTRGITPFKNDDYLTDGTLDNRVDWVTGMGSDVRLRDLPSFIRTTDPNDIMFEFLQGEAENCLQSSSIIFNTFLEFEKEALDTLVSKFNYSNIYTIGPLPLLEKNVPKSEANSFNSSLWKPDSKVFEWLDEKAPGSVVYVNYGSITTMTIEHLHEFAWGLAKSNWPFLWIVRPDVVKDDDGEFGSLGEDFLEEIKDRGLLVSWCAQDQVLVHESIGVFLTHCGWNSMIESVSCGVPVICWPFFADQQTNSYYACGEWGIGMEIDSDVKRDEVAGLIKEMMGGGRGKKMRMKAKEWQRKAEEATNVGGGSYVYFDKFIKEALHFDG